MAEEIKEHQRFIMLSSSWSLLSVQLLITLAKKLLNSSLTVSASSSRFVCMQVTLARAGAMHEEKNNERNMLLHVHNHWKPMKVVAWVMDSQIF